MFANTDSLQFSNYGRTTNHLDVQAKEALKSALMDFAGTVLLVSHEEAFYREWAQRVISVEK